MSVALGDVVHVHHPDGTWRAAIVVNTVDLGTGRLGAAGRVELRATGWFTVQVLGVDRLEGNAWRDLHTDRIGDWWRPREVDRAA